MFKLTIHDRKGAKLKIGDILKISDGKEFTFFAEIKYLEKEQALTPFHTFSFHSFEKVNEIPKDAHKSTEERYNICINIMEKLKKTKELKNSKIF